MSFSDLAALGDLVSGVAVPVSLVFLYFQVRQVNLQVRQTEKNQQAMIQQGRAARSMDLVLRVADAGLIKAWTDGRAGSPDLSETEFHQFFQIFRSFLLNIEDSFFQHQRGLLDDTAFNSQLAGIRPLLAQPGSRAMWRLVRTAYEETFVDFIDQAIEGAPVARFPELPTLWRRLIEAEEAAAAVAP
jgi:hypothetical protein